MSNSKKQLHHATCTPTPWQFLQKLSFGFPKISLIQGLPVQKCNFWWKVEGWTKVIHNEHLIDFQYNELSNTAMPKAKFFQVSICFCPSPSCFLVQALLSSCSHTKKVSVKEKTQIITWMNLALLLLFFKNSLSSCLSSDLLLESFTFTVRA